MTHVAKTADDGFEHLLNLDGALLQLRGMGAEVEAQGVELQADGAQHLADFIVEESRDSAILCFPFGDESEEQFI